MTCIRSVVGYGFISTLLGLGVTTQAVAFSNNCSQYFGVDRVACEETGRTVPEVVVTGSSSFGPLYGAVSAPGVRSSPQPPQIPLAPSQNNDKEREKCLKAANRAEKNCTAVYSNTGDSMCTALMGLFGGVGGVYGAGAGLSIGWLPCNSLKNWSSKQCRILGDNKRKACN